MKHKNNTRHNRQVDGVECGKIYQTLLRPLSIDVGSYYSHIGAKDFSKVVKILDDGTEVKCND